MEFLDDYPIQRDFLSEEYNLLKPDHEHSLATILPTILEHWDQKIDLNFYPRIHADLRQKLQEVHPSGYRNIVFVIVDGIGAQHLASRGGVLWDNISSQGTIASSTFPSMTSTAMTSLLYAMNPINHGIVGYNIYNEHLQWVWNSLRMRYMDSNNQVHEVLNHVNLPDLVSGSSVPDLIQKQVGYDLLFLTPNYLRPPGLGNILIPTLQRNTYQNYENAVSKISSRLNSDAPQFIALYLLEVDTAGHNHGPKSKEYETAITRIEQLIAELRKLPQIRDGSTLILVTSDHGQVQLDYSISKWQSKQTWQKLRTQGTLLSSSGRVIHGYNLNHDPESTREVLEEMAGEHGMVIEQAQAIQLAGGEGPHYNRLGDYLLLYADNFIASVPNSLSATQDPPIRGQHGSLTSRELYVPVTIF